MTNTLLSSIESNRNGYSRVPAITSFFSIGKSTWWKWVADGKAPPPIKLGKKTTVWKNSAILDLAASFEQNSVQEG
jgi:predicted DNA-binding transcriptional regulator AlpA